MSSTVLSRLREKRHGAVGAMKAITIAADDGKRDFTDLESKRLHELDAEIDEIDERIGQLEADEKRAIDTEAQFAALRGTPAPQYPPGHPSGGAGHPLAVSAGYLSAVAEQLATRTSGRVSEAEAEAETRAALVTGTFGQPAAWAANVLDGPRLLHVAAGVPVSRVDAVLAEHPSLTLPTAQGSVGETVSLGEFDASTTGTVTLARFGRWTDFSRESQAGTDAGAVLALHRLGIALDLDAVLVTATETDAGTPVAFDADVPAAIRRALAAVQAATAAADVATLVVLVHPDDIALLEDVNPTGGRTIAEAFNRFSGALVYPSTAVATGFVTVANLRAGTRYFEARALSTETDIDIKTSVMTAATSVIAGYGSDLTTGYAVQVDVVTP